MMDTKFLVVNGQSRNLNKSGGSGKYGMQLYMRFANRQQSDELREYDLVLLNFAAAAAQNAGSASERGKSTSDYIKHAVHRCTPPALYDQLLKFYQNVNGCAKPASTVADAVDISNRHDWTQLTQKTLLHELTSYDIVDGIGRMSLSPCLMLAVTFLDILDFFYPDHFEEISLRYRRLTYSFYKDRADVFFAISEFTKQTMVDRLGIDSDRIIVTHLAADDLLTIQPSADTCDWVSSFGRYWLYPAKAWKHKNHEFLLKCLGKRKNELKRAGVCLLLTGGFDEADKYRLEKLISENNLLGQVKVLGFVSDEQLQALIMEAEYLVFPSLFEGFGMPILEAMSLGCPVLSSRAASLPEVGGDAAEYFDPTNEEEFIALIDSVLSENGIDREAMILKGHENAKRFSWDKTFRETVEVYKDLL